MPEVRSGEESDVAAAAVCAEGELAMSSATDRYTIISADTHAGASHNTYREYLDPAFRDDFDAWRGQYKTPKAYKDLTDNRRMRNWDNDIRNSQQDADGVVGG